METNQQIVKIEELEKRLNSVNKSLKTQGLELISINDYFNSINTMLKIFNHKLDSIFFSHGNNFNYKATYGLPFKVLGTGSVRPPRIYFVCNPNVKVHIKVTGKVRYETYDGASNGYLRMLLNTTSLTENIVHEETFEYNGTFYKNFDFTYEFQPEQEGNNILFVFHCGQSFTNKGISCVEELNVEIYGCNVAFLSRDYSLRVFTTKSNYYITKNLFDSVEYKKFAINSVDLSSQFTTLTNLAPIVETYGKNLNPFNVTYVPNIILDSTNNSFIINDTNNTMFYAAYSYNNYVGYLKLEASVNSEIPIEKGFTYTVGHPINLNNKPYNLGIVHSNKECNLFAVISGLTDETSLKFNNDSDLGIFVENVTVYAKDWEDNFGNRPYCFIVTNENAEIYFLNSINSSYKIYIGKGHQVNAYMQSDLSINVYYRWINNVYKKVLIYNSTSQQYELQSGETVFENAWEYIEGYSNDYFINRLGTWEYVPATN